MKVELDASQQRESAALDKVAAAEAAHVEEVKEDAREGGEEGEKEGEEEDEGEDVRLAVDGAAAVDGGLG